MSDLQMLEDSLYEAEAALNAIKDLNGPEDDLNDYIDKISVNISAARNHVSNHNEDSFEEYVTRAYEAGQRIRLNSHQSDDVLFNYATKLTKSLDAILETV